MPVTGSGNAANQIPRLRQAQTSTALAISPADFFPNTSERGPATHMIFDGNGR